MVKTILLTQGKFAFVDDQYLHFLYEFVWHFKRVLGGEVV